MTIKTKICIITIFLFFTIGSMPASVSASGKAFSYYQLPNQESKLDLVKAERADVLRELYIDNLITLQIVQQPAGNSNFVTQSSNSVTEFKTASIYGTVGLLAHNYLAGQYFSQISPGQEIVLVYEDNSTRSFVVTDIQRYQALVPNSPSSDFTDIITRETFTASQLFKKVYKNQTGNLVLQTCIDAYQNPSWGRLFIIAEPVRNVPTKGR
jgi:hypothetical protein